MLEWELKTWFLALALIQASCVTWTLPFSGSQFPFLRSEACLFCSLRTFCVGDFCDSVRAGGLQDLGAVDLDKELNLQVNRWPTLPLAPKHTLFILNLKKIFLNFYSK